ncbi:hypothetical protein TorRG33x02_350030, partial [Trema orientale]
MKDAKKPSKKRLKSGIVQLYKDNLSMSLEDFISTEQWQKLDETSGMDIPQTLTQLLTLASLYTLKYYNENAPAIALAFDKQKKAKRLPRK